MLGKLIVIIAVVLSTPLLEAPSSAARIGASDHSISDVVDVLIQDMRRRFASTPLIRHLKTVQDGDHSQNEAAKRKSFLPYMTFFVNSFSDLNRMILPFKDPQNDKIKIAINQHCEEDSTHMKLLWEDLAEYSPSMQESGIGNFASSVEFLWDDALYATRKLSYEVSRMVGSTGEDNPMYRYAMIRVMEEVGNVFFTTGAGYRLPNGLPSRYISHDHLDLENGHLQDGESQHGDGLEELFEERMFANDDEKETMIRVMNETYQLFEDMLQAVYEGMETSQFAIHRHYSKVK